MDAIVVDLQWLGHKFEPLAHHEQQAVERIQGRRALITLQAADRGLGRARAQSELRLGEAVPLARLSNDLASGTHAKIIAKKAYGVSVAPGRRPKPRERGSVEKGTAARELQRGT